MATTTPNYGWAVPTSTDLVKDGATAIETLGDAIDASMNTALGTKKAGMVLLNTTSFTGVASQTIDSVFSSTYDAYRIVIEFTNASSVDNYLQFRVGGVTATTNYTYNGTRTNGATTTVFTSGPGGEIYFSSGSGAVTKSYCIEIFDVAKAASTRVLSIGAHDAAFVGTFTGFHTTATAYDGIVFTSPVGNMTNGTVSIYGYNK